MVVLSCCETGRFWRVRSEMAATWLARRLGLKDYEVSEE
jgi:hypothetical protein